MTRFAIFCPACNTPATGSFCGRCGRAIPEESIAPPPPVVHLAKPTTPADSWEGDWAAAPPVAPPPAGSSRSVATMVIGGAAGLLFVLAAALGGIVLTRQHPGGRASDSAALVPSTAAPVSTESSSPTSAAPATSTQTVTVTEPATSEASATTSSETSESPPYEEPLDPDAEALATLQSNRENTLAWLHLDDRWVLQLSSKMDGSVDEMQYAEDGGHVFHYPDILAEHERTKELLDGFGIGSLTLLGSDFGRHSADEGRIWVLLADPGGISSAAEATRRCQDLYPGFSGDLLEDHCVPRRLSPPS